MWKNASNFYMELFGMPLALVGSYEWLNHERASTICPGQIRRRIITFGPKMSCVVL